MADLDTKNATIALLLGAGLVAFGLTLVTALDVPVAPPMDVLPLSIFNMCWSAIALYLVSRDIWLGFLAAVLVGFSTAAFPIIVFSEALGPRPVIVVPHFIAVTGDLVIGIGLMVAGIRALMPLLREAVDEDDDEDEEDYD